MALRRVSPLIAALALAIAAPAHAQDDSSTISIGVGIQKVISVPGVARIAIGDRSVADVEVAGDSQILLIGQSEGATTLLVWKSTGARLAYLIRVQRNAPNETIIRGDQEAARRP